MAELVITVSEHSRVSLTPWLPHLSRPIVNTYQAVLTPPPSSHRLPNGLEPGRYLLACGRVEPRKNLGRLVAAHQQSGVRFPLVRPSTARGVAAMLRWALNSHSPSSLLVCATDQPWARRLVPTLPQGLALQFGPADPWLLLDGARQV